jgi:hypothetical protein
MTRCTKLEAQTKAREEELSLLRGHPNVWPTAAPPPSSPSPPAANPLPPPDLSFLGQAQKHLNEALSDLRSVKSFLDPPPPSLGNA